MGIIRGDLSVLSMSNLVQALVLDRSEGLLTVESGTDRRIIRVSPKGIRLVRGSARCHRFERILRRIGRFAPDPAGIGGTAGGLTNRGIVSRLVQEWMFEEICELFTWSRGTFTFQKAAPSEPVEEGPFAPFLGDCDVTTVALEAARWADELPRIKALIRDLRQIPASTLAPILMEKSNLDPEAFEDVLRLVDGKRSVVQILQLSVFPRFIVLQILYSLILQGAIRMMGAEQTMSMPSVAPAPATAAAA